VNARIACCKSARRRFLVFNLVIVMI